MFESDDGTGAIFKFTTNGTKSIFATGLSSPIGLVFDSAGYLYVAENGSGHIYKYTTNGTKSQFSVGCVFVNVAAYTHDHMGIARAASGRSS